MKLTATGAADAPESASRAYSQVVRVDNPGSLVFVSGQLPFDAAGRLVGAGDMEAQARQVFENIRRQLAAVGATFRDVARVNVYALGIKKNGPALRRVRREFVSPDAFPASTLIEVPAFAYDGVMVEVDAIAVLPPRTTG